MATRVLVIDDDIAMTGMLQMMLALKSFEVFTANSGGQGIEDARRLSPDVIVLDLYMPGMDGLQVCRAIRSFSQTPILMLSALNKPGMAAQALDQGADDYLVKPVPNGTLVAHLNNLIRRTRTGPQPLASPGRCLAYR